MMGDQGDEFEVRFYVPGKPVPGGSKRAFAHKTTGKIIVQDMGVGNKNWRATIADIASKAFTGDLLDGPLEVEFHFVMPRPKSHFYTGKKRGGVLRADAPEWHTSPPDALKLARATEDSLKNVVYRDDCLIGMELITKRYGARPGVEVILKRLER